MDVSTSFNAAAMLDSLAGIVGPAQVITDAHDIEPYVTDWRRMFGGPALAAVRPADTAQVAAVVRACAAAGVGIIAQGGNTGLAGGAVPIAGREGPQIVLSLARMTAIRDVDPVGMTMLVQAGCVLAAAQEAAADAGLLLPISFGAQGSARLGGVISTNAGGVNVLRYGMTRQSVLGLEVVLADGSVVNGLRRLHKDNAGYDWKQIFIGSEGTLGIVTAAVLRLVPRPRERGTALLAVPTPEAALALLARARGALGDGVTAFELISGRSLRIVERHFGGSAGVGDAPWFVLMEAAGSIGGLRAAVEDMLVGAIEAGEATDGVLAESETQANALWSLREHITDAEKAEGPSVKHDVSVPVADIPAFLAEASAAVAAAHAGAWVNAFGHVGDGNIHFNVVIPPGMAPHAVNHTVHEIVARFAGSISAEHGIGQYRIGELATYKSAPELALQRRLKQAMDPDGLLNPGKLLPG